MEEMMKETRIYDLPVERTLSYFLNHIGCGNLLSEMVCKKIDFKMGRFFTILPKEIDLEKLFQFECGGVVFPSYCDDKSKTIITMDADCSQYIYEFLNKEKSNVAIVENYMLEPESPFAPINNVQMSLFNSEVYYVLRCSNTNEEIYKTIRKSCLVWHSLVVMSCMKTNIPDKLTDLLISDICINAKFVITGAYDGEGYIFWQRNEYTEI